MGRCIGRCCRVVRCSGGGSVWMGGSVGEGVGGQCGGAGVLGEV